MIIDITLAETRIFEAIIKFDTDEDAMSFGEVASLWKGEFEYLFTDQKTVCLNIEASNELDAAERLTTSIKGGGFEIRE